MMVTTGSPTAPKERPLLPDGFAGWAAADKPKPVTDPAELDNANVAALKEYGFTGGVTATYKRDGETLTIRALRFQDASGAYGAYSFYRQNGWPKEDIGAGATSDHNRVLFWKGDTVVDATFSHIGPMSAGEMRELASDCPSRRETALCPPILANLPQGSLDEQTTHYALGPAGYAGAGGVLPPELVGFDRGAEAVTANYSLLRPRHAHHHRLSHAADGRGAGAEDSRLHQGRQQGAAAMAQAACRTPTWLRLRCGAAGRWSPSSAATPFPTRATSCSRWFTTRRT